MEENRACKALYDDNMPRIKRNGKKVDWIAEDFSFDQINRTLLSQKASNSMTHIIPEHTPISNQGSYGTCAANAGVDLFEMLLGIEQGPEAVVQFSRMFAYRLARVMHKATDVDEGTYLRAVFHQMRKVGVIEEKYFPYKKENLFKSPDLDLYTMASNNRIHSFYKVKVKGEEKLLQIRVAIEANHPVAFCTPVSREFCKYDGGRYVWSYDDMTHSVGNHAMIITGVSKVGGQDIFLTRNSWGEDWGDKGHCWMSESLVKKLAYDVWVGTRMREFI